MVDVLVALVVMYAEVVDEFAMVIGQGKVWELIMLLK